MNEAENMGDPSEPNKPIQPPLTFSLPGWERLFDPYERWEWHITETFKGLITLSTEVVKILALANGGAAVALLAYLGNVVHNPGVHPPHLSHALLWFCYGLFATLLAVIFAYLAQLKLYNEERKKRQQISLPELERKLIREHHGWILAVAILLAGFAAFEFLTGCLSAASAISRVSYGATIDLVHSLNACA